MNVRSDKSLRCLTGTLTCAILCLYCLPAGAADAENCMMCHKYQGLGRQDASGAQRLFYVSENSYTHTVHGRLRCTGCHTNVTEFPHADIEKVNCAVECHLAEPSTGVKFSHRKMIESFNASVHGVCDHEDHAVHPEDLPTCTYCHQNRILDPLSSLRQERHGIAREVMDRCLGCHEDEGWTRTYFSHLTHRLKLRRSSREMVALCTSCHENEARMKRHGLETTGTYRDTFHWKAIKYGNENAPNCIDCHAPVGFFSHEIMPKTDPRSAVHKDNLVSTCSNQFGMQQCHPDATPAFASGTIHPSGLKAHVFDIKLAASFSGDKKPAEGMRKFSSLLEQKTQEEYSRAKWYQYRILEFIRIFYKILIGGLISFMIFHQVLDFLATRREQKRRSLHGPYTPHR